MNQVDLSAVLAADSVRHQHIARSKKRLIEDASEVLALRYPALNSRKLFDGLMARERLGSTALGEGVAIPHCRMPDLDRSLGALFQLSDGVDFDAPDDRPVDLLFALVVPEDAVDAHLHILASLAGLFGDAAVREELRASPDSTALYNSFTMAR